MICCDVKVNEYGLFGKGMLKSDFMDHLPAKFDIEIVAGVLVGVVGLVDETVKIGLVGS